MANVTHGHDLVGHRSAEYRSWAHMKERCNNPRCDRFPYYGGRGITVCERWSSFENFLADMGPRPPGHTLDRIDNNGPYTGPCSDYPQGNCRWATKSEQMKNRRRMPAMFVDLNDEPMTWFQMAEQLAMPRADLRAYFASAGIKPIRRHMKPRAVKVAA